MPVKTRDQYRYMKAVETGNVKDPNLSAEQAAEMTSGQKYRDLPKDRFADGGVVNTGKSLSSTRKQSYAPKVKDLFGKLKKKLESR